MTGEMSSPVDRNEWSLHAAIADAFNGELRPFDVYQGPYILIDNPNGRNFKLWLVPDEEHPEVVCRVYDERSEKLSDEIHYTFDDAIEQTILRVQELTGLNPDEC